MVYKVDGNQKKIIIFLRKMGFTVKVVAMVDGFVDIVVGIFGLNFLCEIKDPDKPPSARKLTYLEQKFHDEWKGFSCVLLIEEDCIKLYNLALKMKLALQGVELIL